MRYIWLLFVVVLVLAGCQTTPSIDYQQLWTTYYKACSNPEFQVRRDVKSESGQTLYTESRGCTIKPPPAPGSKRDMVDYAVAISQIVGPQGLGGVALGLKQLEVNEANTEARAEMWRGIVQSIGKSSGDRLSGGSMKAGDDIINKPDNSSELLGP